VQSELNPKYSTCDHTHKSRRVTKEVPNSLGSDINSRLYHLQYYHSALHTTE